MKRMILVFTAIVLAIQWAGCSSMKVATHYDSTVDFSEYHTYKFVKPKYEGRKNGAANSLITKEILLEVRPVMEAKGLVEVDDAKEADILIHFYTFVQNKHHVSPPTYHVGRWGRTWVASPGHVAHYKEGTLGIDIVDREKKELVWQGVGRDVLDRDNPTENFVEAAKKILEDFPPVR